jgi:hypothetical protein
MSDSHVDFSFTKIKKTSAGLRGKYVRVKPEVWKAMRAAYAEHPTALHVQEKAGVGQRMSTRAIKDGWPELGYPPLDPKRAAALARAGVKPVVAQVSNSVAPAAVIDVPGVPVVSDQDPESPYAQPARTSLAIGIKAGQVLEEMLEQTLTAIDEKRLSIPEELDGKWIATITKAAQSVTSAIKAGIDAQRMARNEVEPDAEFEILKLVGRCSVEELLEITTTGNIPKRLMQGTGGTVPEIQFEDEDLPDDFAKGDAHEDPLATQKGK